MISRSFFAKGLLSGNPSNVRFVGRCQPAVWLARALDAARTPPALP